MGKGNNLFGQQLQAKQLRAIERATAAAAGQEPRKLSWTERYVLGVKDPKTPPAQSAPRSDSARIAELEVRVVALEARVQWAIDRIQKLQSQDSTD